MLLLLLSAPLKNSAKNNSEITWKNRKQEGHLKLDMSSNEEMNQE